MNDERVLTAQARTLREMSFFVPSSFYPIIIFTSWIDASGFWFEEDLATRIILYN